MTCRPCSCPNFFFLPSLCLLSRRGAVLKLIILVFRISVTSEGSAHIWLDFSYRCYASTAYAAIAITVRSTRTFFFLLRHRLLGMPAPNQSVVRSG